jgi:hypothetical protein
MINKSMTTLKHYYQKQFHTHFLLEMVNDREDILECVHEMEIILNEYNFDVLGVEDDYIVEAEGIGKFGIKQITNILRAAAAVSNGQPTKRGILSTVEDRATAVKQLASRMIAAIKKSARKLQETEPVQRFEIKSDMVLNKWKRKLGNDHESVKKAENLVSFGKRHPRINAFILSLLSALTSALGTPAFGAASDIALDQATKIAKGNANNENGINDHLNTPPIYGTR